MESRTHLAWGWGWSLQGAEPGSSGFYLCHRTCRWAQVAPESHPAVCWPSGELAPPMGRKAHTHQTAFGGDQELSQSPCWGSRVWVGRLRREPFTVSFYPASVHVCCWMFRCLRIFILICIFTGPHRRGGEPAFGAGLTWMCMKLSSPV